VKATVTVVETLATMAAHAAKAMLSTGALYLVL
jgi:hypothetical protein